MTQHPSSSRNQSRGGLALRPGMTASLICGLREGSSDLCLPLWRFQESQRRPPYATMTMSMDREEKTRQQPRQGSLLRPRPIGQDRGALSRGRACRSYASACLDRGTHEFALPLDRALGPTCMRNPLFQKPYRLTRAAIGDFRVQIGQFRTLNQRIPGSSPGAPHQASQGLSERSRLRRPN